MCVVYTCAGPEVVAVVAVKPGKTVDVHQSKQKIVVVIKESRN